MPLRSKIFSPTITDVSYFSFESQPHCGVERSQWRFPVLIRRSFSNPTVQTFKTYNPECSCGTAT